MAEEIQFQNEDSVMLQKPSDYLHQQSKFMIHKRMRTYSILLVNKMA